MNAETFESTNLISNGVQISYSPPKPIVTNTFIKQEEEVKVESVNSAVPAEPIQDQKNNGWYINDLFWFTVFDHRRRAYQ